MHLKESFIFWWSQVPRRELFTIGLILLMAAFLRLYRLPSMASYDFDQEYVTSFVLDVVRVYPVQLVGQGLSIQGLFMGPWYFYFLVPWYALTAWHPLGGFLGSVFLGLLIVLMNYLLGKELFGVRAGLLAAFLRAGNFWAITADWAMVPAFSSDLLVLVVYYAWYQLYRGRSYYLLILALSVGLVPSFHPVHLPLVFVSILLIWLWKLRFSLRQWLGAGALVLLPNLPLILFEYYRKGAMLRRVWELLAEGGAGGGGGIISKLLTLIGLQGQFFAELSQLPIGRWLATVLLIVFALLFFGKVLQKEQQFHRQALLLSMTIFILYYALFPGQTPEYYVTALRALLFVYVAVVLAWLSRSRLGSYALSAYLLFFSSTTASQLWQRWQDDNLSTLAKKDAIVQEILKNQSGGSDFAVSYVVQPGWGSGFQSLFRLYRQEPSGVVPVYTIVAPIDLVQPEELSVVEGNVGLIEPDETEP